MLKHSVVGTYREKGGNVDASLSFALWKNVMLSLKFLEVVLKNLKVFDFFFYIGCKDTGPSLFKSFLVYIYSKLLMHAL